MELEASNQPKQERSRTRWTASLDKIFADLVVKQIQLGNRPNNVFDKKTWNHIRDEFNRQTDLSFNNNQLRKHLDVLRTRFYNLKSAYDQNNDFVMDDSCCIGFEQWDDIGAQPRHETVKGKDCPIYEQLCAIFIDSAADGKYAQSSHYEELDKSFGTDASGFTPCLEAKVSHYENPSTSKSIPGNISTSEKVTKNSLDRKRKRSYETQTTGLDQDTCNAMAEALLDMVAVSRLRAVVSSVSDDKFSITNCIKALDEIEGIDQQLYFSALDLFENPSLREIFISLKSVKIRNGRMKEASRIFSEMKDSTLIPDVVTYNTFIATYAGDSMFAEAIDVVRYMIKQGCKPDQNTYNSIVDWYCKLNRRDEANSFVKSLRNLDPHVSKEEENRLLERIVKMWP
ncbi:hypothetical protein LR48_Vigan07g279300 [Vigna angularis]|uniref:Myb/SANT-like domain-containing protein n=1 Tax=Phaseolus angularis TaxID=3914 RepID=A0A0L9V2X7_PHAAN|nr:hypothetical protein LR48_Vigan07g279300 [Vigna angularis]